MRVFLQYVVPLLLPLAIYVGYLIIARRIQRGQGPLAAQMRQWPWAWLAVAGVALLAISLLAFNLTTGSDPGGVYVPPKLEDGKVVPGHVE